MKVTTNENAMTAQITPKPPNKITPKPPNKSVAKNPPKSVGIIQPMMMSVIYSDTDCGFIGLDSHDRQKR